MEERNGKTIRLSTAILLFIILILIATLAAVYYLGFIKKDEIVNENKIAETKTEIQKENKENDTISNVTPSNNQPKVENKSTEERYKEYLANLKANLVKELDGYYDEYNLVSIRQNNMVGHEYTINIDKDLNLLVTSHNNSAKKQCTDYKIDKDVLKVYVAYIGNGGMQSIFYIKTDGAIYTYAIDELLNNENPTSVKLEEYKNIINVYSVEFNDGMSGGCVPIFEDIDGNLCHLFQ